MYLYIAVLIFLMLAILAKVETYETNLSIY